MQANTQKLHFYDIDTVASGSLPDYDICIVGSGPAGLVVAAELAHYGFRLAILESGALRDDGYGEGLASVVSSGIHITNYSRVRAFGGTSTTWAGLSAPLDPIDFTFRPYVPFSGWPLSYDELVPFWNLASERYSFPSFSFFSNGEFTKVKEQNELALTWNNVSEKIFLSSFKPLNFGKKLEHIFSTKGVDLYYKATVTQLRAGETRNKIDFASVVSRQGKKYNLKAKIFVVAANGIENARLLLASKDLCSAGLGNEHDQVGRFLMNHPKGFHGIIHLKQPVRELPYYFGCIYKQIEGYAGLRLAEDEQKKLGISNSYVRFEPLFPWSDNNGVIAFLTIIKRARWLFNFSLKLLRGKVIQLRDYAETGDDSNLQSGRKSLVDWVTMVGMIFINIHMVVWYLSVRLRKNVRMPVSRIRLRNFMEMVPMETNRVTLSPNLDSNGEPKAAVQHETTPYDRSSLAQLHHIIGQELINSGFGTLESSLEKGIWPINQDASHHLGTTRMGDNPAHSVVDKNLRLHSVPNVFIAGGSVFPTSGCANPTYTICALSIRLARHLSSVMQQVRAR